MSRKSTAVKVQRDITAADKLVEGPLYDNRDVLSEKQMAKSIFRSRTTKEDSAVSFDASAGSGSVRCFDVLENDSFPYDSKLAEIHRCLSLKIARKCSRINIMLAISNTISNRSREKRSALPKREGSAKRRVRKKIQVEVELTRAVAF